jgi:glyoxylase-like metal-dependent hydrolase (beta-lactamase superfamily II)
MPFTRITLLNGGHCRQLGYLAGRSSPGPTDFQAVFVLLEHDVHGMHLIDTGYSEDFLAATNDLPEKLYRWTTPVTLHAQQNAAAILAARGIAARDVRSIFLSHFHADHMAGLGHFPEARFVYRRDAYESLQRYGATRRVTHGFLANLLPRDFVARGHALEESQFAPGASPFDAFRVFDYFGDGDLLLVDLRGHSAGHTGFAIRGTSEPVFYIADATWDRDALLAGRRLPAASRWFQQSIVRYEQTQQSLRAFAAAHPEWQMLACHCPRTQAHVDCH